MPEPTGTRHITTWARGLLPPLFLAAMIIVGACDFQLLEPPELPRWGFSLTIPLINTTYNLSELAENDTTISVDTDTSGGVLPTNELRIEFSDTLQRTEIEPDFLAIELPPEASIPDIDTSFNAPDASDFFIPVDELVTVEVALDSLLEAVGFGSVSFPALVDVKIDSSFWNTFVATESVDRQEETQVVDEAVILADSRFIKDLRYVQLSATPGENQFITSVTNDQFPTDIDTVELRLVSGYLDEVHLTTGLASPNTSDQTTDLASDSVGSLLTVGIHITMPTVTDTVVIPAGDEPKIFLSTRLVVGGVDSLGITTDSVSLLPEPPAPLPLSSDTDIEITSAVLETDDPPPGLLSGIVNEMELKILENTLPFDIRFGLTFPNFASDSTLTDSLAFGPHTLGDTTIDDLRSIEGYTFHNPAGNEPISEFEYELVAEVVEQDIVLQLDGSSLGTFRASFTMGDLYFESITGNFFVSFETVPTTIQDIPTGFADFQFGRLSLSLLLRNQIRLPVQLDLRLTGRTYEGDSVAVPIDAPINYPNDAPNVPATNGDTAWTIIILDQNGTSTYWVPEGDTSIVNAWDSTITKANGGQTIVDVLNLPPDIITVGGDAVIQGEGTVATGKGVWGEFDLIAPFAFILPKDISFLPVAPIPLAPMDEETREQIQTALLSASLTSTVQTDFPIGGKISMLASNDTMFTLALDYLDDIAAGYPTAARTGDDSVYSTVKAVLEADYIMGVDKHKFVFYPETGSASSDPRQTRAKKVEFFPTSGNTFWIGHLFDIELPSPSAFTEEGWVDIPGYAEQVITLDAERIGWIASDTTVYLKTFITLYNTIGIDSVRTIQSTNSIHFAAFITFNLASDILGEEEEPDSSEIEVTPIPDMTLVPDSIATVYLDSVFDHPDKEVKDLDLAATTSHAGIATAAIRTVRTGGTARKVLRVTAIGPGTARITVSADDDPEDDIDPVSASFLVTVEEAGGEGAPPKPSAQHKIVGHARLW